jgi:hypothetical protein
MAMGYGCTADKDCAGEGLSLKMEAVGPSEISVKKITQWLLVRKQTIPNDDRRWSANFNANFWV